MNSHQFDASIMALSAVSIDESSPSSHCPFESRDLIDDTATNIITGADTFFAHWNANRPG